MTGNPDIGIFTKDQILDPDSKLALLVESRLFKL